MADPFKFWIQCRVRRLLVGVELSTRRASTNAGALEAMDSPYSRNVDQNGLDMHGSEEPLRSNDFQLPKLPFKVRIGGGSFRRFNGLRNLHLLARGKPRRLLE